MISNKAILPDVDSGALEDNAPKGPLLPDVLATLNENTGLLPEVEIEAQEFSSWQQPQKARDPILPEFHLDPKSPPYKEKKQIINGNSITLVTYKLSNLWYLSEQTKKAQRKSPLMPPLDPLNDSFSIERNEVLGQKKKSSDLDLRKICLKKEISQKRRK